LLKGTRECVITRNSGLGRWDLRHPELRQQLSTTLFFSNASKDRQLSLVTTGIHGREGPQRARGRRLWLSATSACGHLVMGPYGGCLWRPACVRGWCFVNAPFSGLFETCSTAGDKFDGFEVEHVREGAELRVSEFEDGSGSEDARKVLVQELVVGLALLLSERGYLVGHGDVEAVVSVACALYAEDGGEFFTDGQELGAFGGIDRDHAEGAGGGMSEGGGLIHANAYRQGALQVSGGHALADLAVADVDRRIDGHIRGPASAIAVLIVGAVEDRHVVAGRGGQAKLGTVGRCDELVVELHHGGAHGALHRQVADDGVAREGADAAIGVELEGGVAIGELERASCRAAGVAGWLLHQRGATGVGTGSEQRGGDGGALREELAAGEWSIRPGQWFDSLRGWLQGGACRSGSGHDPQRVVADFGNCTRVE
jgi:hypothetical protein